MKRVMTWEIPGVTPQRAWWKNMGLVALLAAPFAFLAMLLSEEVFIATTNDNAIHFTYGPPLILAVIAAVFGPLTLLVGGILTDRKRNRG